MASATLQSAYEQLAELENKTQRTVSATLSAATIAEWRQRYAFDALTNDNNRVVPEKIALRAELSLQLTISAVRWVNEKKWLVPELQRCMAPYWWLCACYGAAQDSSWVHPSHPVIVILERLLRFGRSFQATAESQTLLSNLARGISDAAMAAINSDDAVVQTMLRQIQQLLNEQQTKIADNDRQLLAKEMHLLRTTHVHSAVTRAIRYAMLGKSPHTRILNFIDDVWRKFLSVIYLRVGLENDEWDRAMADIDMMLWLSDGASPDDIKRALNYDVAQLVERLRQASQSIRGVEQLLASFIEWFADMVVSRANEMPIEVDFGLNLDTSAEQLIQAGVAMSGTLSDEDSLLQTLRLIQANDAIHIRTFEGWKRARFIDVDLAHDVYLIGDCYGNRLAALGRREMVSSINAGKMALIENGSVYASLEPLLAELVEQVATQWRADYMAKLDAQKRAQEAKLMAELDVRRKREAEERAARIKAARAQADFEQRTQHCRELAKRLRAGAMVHVENSEGKLRPAFLAMVSGGNGQYVFVERNGRRIASLGLEDVILALFENRMQVLESGSAIDATLSNMVKERRQFLQEEA